MFDASMKQLHISISRILATALMALSGMNLFAQIVISDSFDDGEILNNPTWQGNTDKFSASTNELQLVDLVAGQSYLSTAFTSANLNDRQWNFFIKQTFAGSDNNQSRVYLSSSGSALNYTGAGSAGVQGYFLRFGEGGSGDAIRLFRDNGTTTTEIGSGTSALIAASFQVRIKVTRNNSGVWSIYADPTGGTNYQLEFTATDNTYNTSTNFGMVCTYTASNADNFFFDDIYFGDIIVDTTPPQLISATPIDGFNLDVLFSEPLSASSAEDENNYQVSGNNPSSAVLDNSNPSLVHLTFLSAFQPNTTLTLQVVNIEDVNNNTLLNGQTDFIFVVPASAGYRDVVFNEVLADPTPTVGLPEVEYIELYNASSETFNLQGWTLVNSTTPKILPAFTLLPGAYVVLCSDASTSLFNQAIGIPSFTALTNSEDSLTLLDNTSAIIDMLVYKDDWFDTSSKLEGGWSLEQINPMFDCANSANNWSESNDPSGGTPGTINSVFNDTPDTQIPSILSSSVVDENTIFIQFSELMDTTGTAGFNFSLQPFNSASNAVWNTSLDGLTLQTQSPILFETYYTLFIEGLSDCSGNILPSAQIDFVLGLEPQPGDVIINEIYADPDASTGSPGAEFIEVFNTTDHLLELTNVKLNNGVFTQQVLLLPNDYLIIADSDNGANFLLINKKGLMPAFPSLTNSGLALTLSNAAGETLDEVIYNISWYGDPSKDDGGYSLELINPEDPCSAADNWKASNSPTGSTPAAINSVYDNTPDVLAPQLLFVLTEPAEKVSLVFNEPIDETSFEDLIWTVNSATIETPNAVLSDTANNVVILDYGIMTAGVIYNFELSGLSDCWGNEIAMIQNRFALPETAQPGDLIINELLTNPFDGGKDFIEIYNRSMRNISIANWKIADYTSGQMNTPKVITESNFILFPGEYLAITETGANLNSFYPGTRLDRVFITEDLPDFSSEDIAVLVMPDNITSDQFSYNPDYHYALLDDTKGVSMERISATRLSSDQTNWHSASQASGFATPGYVNSQSNAEAAAGGELEVSPEIFSPDNDGYRDIVTFTYKMEKEGFLGNITIYDSEGRRVRRLMQSELLGATGSISWDGFNDERLKAAIGIYMIYFEAFGLDGDVIELKKTCVLAHQLN